MMQVPASITLSNDSSPRRQKLGPGFFDNATFPMDIPEKLTGTLCSINLENLNVSI